jgi:hypothetical protein
MSHFQNLRYVTTSGLTAPYEQRSPDSPNNPNWTESEIAGKVLRDKFSHLAWEFNGETHRLFDTYRSGFALDSTADLLVACLASSDQLVIMNPDASVRQPVDLPVTVELHYPGSPVRSFPVEGVVEVLQKNGRVIVGLGNRYEYVQRRFFDVATAKWGKVVENYRR